jgi:TolB-like protein/tetratricopeptide (TPR) repeat protein
MPHDGSNLWRTVGEHATAWMVGGVLLAATGFAPEEWLAHTVRGLHIPESVLHLWAAGIDVRVVPIAIGVAVIAIGMLRQQQASHVPINSPATRADAPLADAPAPLKSVDQPHPQGYLDVLPLPEKPSIAVLAFTNMSGDADQEYFSDGIADDIITELSRSHSLYVIARNSSFTYKGHAIDVKQVARELGVRYVVEGSVRRSGDRVRVTAQLIHAETASHVWAERYDRSVADVFAVQDEITTAVTLAIEPAITDTEQQRVARKAPESLGAWESYQRGLWHWGKTTSVENEIALSLFRRATSLDPTFSRAFQGWAGAQVEEGSLYFTRPMIEAIKLAEPLAHKAIALDPSDGSAHAILALVQIGGGNLEAAHNASEQALALTPNSPMALLVKGACLIAAGSHRNGCEVLRAALRCNPLDKRNFRVLNNLAYGLYLLRDYEGAVEAAKRAMLANSSQTASFRLLAAALGQLGRIEEAHDIIQRATIALAPNSFDAYARRQFPWDTDEAQAHYLDGIRKAGWQG